MALVALLSDESLGYDIEVYAKNIDGIEARGVRGLAESIACPAQFIRVEGYGRIQGRIISWVV